MTRSAEQIAAGAIRCANALFARGVAPGATIGVFLADGDAKAATFGACERLRATAIETEAEARRAGVVALVHERRDAARIAALRSGIPSLRVVLSVDDGSGVDLTAAGSEDFESALAGAASTWNGRE
jgi:hypothetical protein